MSVINVRRKYLHPSNHQQSGQSCVAYLDSLVPHRTNDRIRQRNERITTNCGAFAVVLRQRDRLLEHSNKRSNAVDVFSIVQSFSADELNYRSNDDIEKAHQIGIATAKALNARFHDNREWAVYTQADGDQHCLHNHLVYMNYNKDLRALKELSWLKTLLPINEAISDKYLTSAKQKAVRQRTLATAEEIIGSPLTLKRQRRRDRRQEAKDHIAKAVKTAISQAETKTHFKLLLLRQDVRIQQRNGTDNEESTETGTETAWKTKSGRYRKSLAFTYHGVTVRSDKLGWSTEAIVNQISENAAARRQSRRQGSQQPSQPVQGRVTKPLTKKATARTVQRQQYSKHLVTYSVSPISRYQLLNLKRSQAAVLQHRLMDKKLTQEARDYLMQKLNRTQAIVSEIQSQISVDLTQREIENERERE